MPLISLFALVSCQSVPIPNVAVYRELPFSDGAEGAEFWTLNDNSRILTPEEWAEKRPYMLMIPPETWSAIKKSWLKACIVAGNKCEYEVESIDSFVTDVDKVVENIMLLQK